MDPVFFASQSDFRKWLFKNHKKETELLVGYYKVGSGKPSMTWPQSVDEALCFGWIDGIRRSIDKISYSIRFTPRKPNSIWSAINIRKAEMLIKSGLMQEAVFQALKKRKANKSKIYSYENEPLKLTEEFEKEFKANKKAWEFFNSQAPSYQKTAVHIVMRGRQETTRIKRLKELISDSESGRKLKSLSYGGKKQINTFISHSTNHC